MVLGKMLAAIEAPYAAVGLPIGTTLMKPGDVTAKNRRLWPFLAWTVNEADDMAQLGALGVAALITDDPDIAKEL